MSDPTTRQREYVRALQRQLHLPDRLLDQHCERTFRAPFRDLDRRQVSQLIDELKGWTALPAELRRAQGQLDLPVI